MLRKIQTWLLKKEQEQKKKVELIRTREYYKLIKAGSLFLGFIKADITKMKTENLNRHSRRRFEKALNNFELTDEMVNYYRVRIDAILDYVNKQLNPPKAGNVTITKPEIKKETK